jgi:hypothetical protein
MIRASDGEMFRTAPMSLCELNLDPNCPHTKTPLVPLQCTHTADLDRVIELTPWLVLPNDATD